MARSAVPRLPAPPEISRDRGACDRSPTSTAPSGSSPSDKTDGLGLIGGPEDRQDVGALPDRASGRARPRLRGDRPDAQARRRAQGAVDGPAAVARSTTSTSSTPEFGINPLLAQGEPAMVADKVVEAFRDVNEEGDISGSSDRYLRQAAQAAIGAAGPARSRARRRCGTCTGCCSRARPRSASAWWRRSTPTRASPTPRRSSGASCRTTCARRDGQTRRPSSTRRATRSCG